MKKIIFFILAALPVYLAVSLTLLDKHYFLCPIAYRSDLIIRSDTMGDGHFGTKRSGNRMHRGVDLLAAIGTPVYAVRSGRVSVSTNQPRGMGNYVVIKHSGGISTLYGHLSEQYVREGEFVRQGETIGAVGKTGNANYPGMQPHLHFEVHKNGTAQEPLEYLQYR
ncbi:MAG: M23 family metallopeptidase [Candidatus Omnitrophica bacterium]|nr:M23 family metallopeptidase [Candidatus Omnitrophota bacterium]